MSLTLAPPVLNALCLVLLVPAVARVTRLVTRDKVPLLAWPRDRFVCRWGVWEDAKADERGKSIDGKRTNWFMSSLAYLWECDWCASVWVAGGLVYLTLRWPEVLVWVLLGLTASYAAGWNALAEARAARERDET
jgi:hypothetical protein